MALYVLYAAFQCVIASSDWRIIYWKPQTHTHAHNTCSNFNECLCRTLEAKANAFGGGWDGFFALGCVCSDGFPSLLSNGINVVRTNFGWLIIYFEAHSLHFIWVKNRVIYQANGSVGCWKWAWRFWAKIWENVFIYIQISVRLQYGQYSVIRFEDAGAD